MVGGGGGVVGGGAGTAVDVVVGAWLCEPPHPTTQVVNVISTTRAAIRFQPGVLMSSPRFRGLLVVSGLRRHA